MDMPEDKSPPGGPRAMSRVLALFATLAQARRGMSLSELAEALEVPKSTLLSSLRGLVADSFLIASAGEYRLGPCAYRLAGAIISSWSNTEMVRHYLRQLASASKESVGYAIPDWEIGQVIYVDAIASPKPVHYAMRSGLRAPIYASAAGRVILAYTAREQRDAYLSHAHMRALTGATRTSPDAIRANLETIAKDGYCASFGEMLEDTAAIAAPVFDSADALTGALMVAAPIDRMRANFPALLAQVLDAGKRASGLIGRFDKPLQHLIHA